MPTLNWNSLRGKPGDVRAIFDYTGRGKPLAVPVFEWKLDVDYHEREINYAFVKLTFNLRTVFEGCGWVSKLTRKFNGKNPRPLRLISSEHFIDIPAVVMERCYGKFPFMDMSSLSNMAVMSFELKRLKGQPWLTMTSK